MGLKDQGLGLSPDQEKPTQTDPSRRPQATWDHTNLVCDCLRTPQEERSEERTEERTEEGTEEREEHLEVTEETSEEDERFEEDSECHAAAKRAGVCATFTDSQETAIVEFVKEHPELYDKEHACFHDIQKKEAEKMTQKEFEDLKGRIFGDIETIKNTCRRQPLPRGSATITTECQRVNILPTTTQQASSSTQAAASSSYIYYTPSPIGFGNPTSVLTVQDEGSRHNLSGILSQLPDMTSTQITEQPRPQQQ